jgi:LacI family transcriptional regulator
MTVSRALRGQHYVSTATREKVEAAAKALHYEVNVLAQNFASKRSGFVGVAVPFGLLGSNYFGEIFKGIHRVFDGQPRNYALFDMLSDSFDDGKKLEKLYLSRRVEGLLVVAPSAIAKFLDTFTDLQMPMVVLGKAVANPAIRSVGCDDYSGIKMACTYLHELGHRKIAFIGGPVGFSLAETRERSYTDFCRNNKLTIPTGYIQRGDYGMKSGRIAFAQLFRLKTRPTAIVAANDMMAFGALEGARKFGAIVPDDVSIAGYDDLPTAAERCPSLTTVHQPVVEIAEKGARMLVDWLDTGKPPERSITLPVSLVRRESTVPPPKGKSSR